MPDAKLMLILGCLLFALALVELPHARTSLAAPAPDADTKAAPATFEVYKDKSGEFRWRLRMQNSKVIASSGQGYKEKDSCLKGIESLKRVVADAPVKEVEASDATKDETEGEKKPNE